MSQDLKNRSIIVALLLVAWAAAIYGKAMLPAQVSDLNVFIVQIQVLLGGVVGYHVGAGSAPAAFTYPPAGPSVLGAPAVQGGFIAWSMMWLLLPIALTAALLGGCTTTTASMYAGLATQAKSGIQVFDDNTLATMHDLLCAQPYSAIQRHPEMQAGIQQLCGPLANASSLDAGQLQLLMSVVGKAQAAGLLAAPAAAPAK